eukprot:TRINITY_DN41444_c0_g1_i1.p1 TRINITY_DN41444_c0_g1~~TRINITY_DN41444_c0_g1_i1.p1  ORF type:complete len:522 (+),score=54.96 TRINITY_DN41444_c0_g1_i1:25-1590(+)
MHNHIMTLRLWWSLASCSLVSLHASDIEPLPGLRRVLVLARHGNRAPNPQVRVVCPNFVPILEQFGVAPAALSRIGMAENEENGIFLRHRYRHFLPEGRYLYDGTYAFFSEREERNIVSTAAMARGMFPPGTGLEGFAPERPNIVPIATTQDGADVIMNCPRDGPCQHALNQDKARWAERHEARIYRKHAKLFKTVFRACGYDLEPGNITYKGKRKDFLWAAKAVMDAFLFARNEGLDHTLGGLIAESVIEEFNAVVNENLHDQIFGMPHQLTYWTGDFIPTLLTLARVPLHEPVNKLHVFLNHRELIYATAHILGIPIEFPNMNKDSLPSGCSLILEVYDDGVRLFFWAPSQPSFEQKARYLSSGRPVKDLFLRGSLLPVHPKACPLQGRVCPVRALASTFVEFVHKTGTYVQICNVSLEDTYFAKGEASLGIVETWVEPSPLAGGRNVSWHAAPSKFSALAHRSASSELAAPVAPQYVGQNSMPMLMLASFLLSIMSGYVGWYLGRRSRQEESHYNMLG